MELDISCVYCEIIRIIESKEKYTIDILLYSLGIREIIHEIKQCYIIPFKFIKFISYISSHIECFLDFSLLEHLCRNEIEVKIIFDKYESYDNISSSGSDSDLNDRINKMLVRDAIEINDLINNNFWQNIKDDEYGEISEELILSSKKLFEKLDRNRDGYISATDIIYLYEFQITHPFILNFNFYEIFTILLTTNNNKIDFHKFMIYFV